MRLPKTSRRPCAPLGELYLGRGDYVAGGAQSLPFLDLDGARRRRPLVFGQVTDDLSSYPSLAADMFSGRQTDPEEWAVMWKEIGADGVWIDLRSGNPEIVRRICERTRLPVAVSAEDDVLEGVSRIDDCSMILIGRNGPYGGPRGRHATAVGGSTADEISERCSAAGDGQDIVIDLGGFSMGQRLSRSVELAEEVRRRALNDDTTLRHPTMCSTVRCWDAGFPDARVASMWEAEAALAAMMAGTDILIVRGPGAADMARVYGEELADL